MKEEPAGDGWLFFFMVKSIYQQMAQGLAQITRYNDFTILYRGKELAVTALLGDTMDVLQPGGLQGQFVAHVKILRATVVAALGQGGEPKSNELVTFPSQPHNGLIPRELMITDLIPDQYSFSFSLKDPTQ